MQDLSATEKTDCFKLAGAIAGRVRDNEQVAITTKGAVPILVVVKAIALAQVTFYFLLFHLLLFFVVTPPSPAPPKLVVVSGRHGQVRAAH